MTRSLACFWWISLVAASAVDFLFWQKSLGISLFIWEVLVIGGGFWLAKRYGVRMARTNLLLIGVAILSSGIVFLRQEPLTRGINILLALGLLGLTAATFTNGFWLVYRVVDYMMAGVKVVIAALVRPVEVIFSRSKESEGTDGEYGAPRRQVVPVLRGLLLAVPVVIVLAALLSSADPIFSQQIQQILKIFDLARLGETIFRLFYVLILAYLFTGVYLHAVLPLKQAEPPETNKPWLSPFLGLTETTVILVCVNLLFMLFVAVQFRYFFGGEVNISQTGYTYSEYARRGFGELVAVALISLLLYLCLGSITRMGKQTEKMRFLILVTILVALVLVILVSAFQRLLLYENAYGFSRLRTYTTVFIPGLALLLLSIVGLEIGHQRGKYSLVLMTVCIGYCLSIGMINVDGLIVHMNIQRARSGLPLDSHYLFELSADAVPAMVDEYQADGLGVPEKNSLGAALACKAAEYRQISGQKGDSWQSVNYADLKANSMLKQMQKQLTNFPIYQVSGAWVVTINGVDEACLPQYFVFGNLQK